MLVPLVVLLISKLLLFATLLFVMDPLFDNANVPALIVVAPEYVLAAVNVTVPAPVFVIPNPAPLTMPFNVNEPAPDTVLLFDNVRPLLILLVPVPVKIPPFNVIF